MIEGVNYIGKHFIVRNKPIGGKCVGVEKGRVVLNTKYGEFKYTLDEIIEIV